MTNRRPLRILAAVALAILTLAMVSRDHGRLEAQPRASLELVVRAPEELESLAGRLRGFDTSRLGGVMTLIGMRDPGPPITVRLAPEGTAIARTTPDWVAGFANSSGGTLVLFPSRIGRYPYGSLERVLYHEVAHVLIGRAARGTPVPRWFNEGLASAAERNWGLEDRSRLAWELVAGGPVTATQLEGMFAEGSREIARAYVLSDALVRDILERHGPSTAARTLRRMAGGEPFDLALYATTGYTVTEHVGAFWSRHVVWERWIAFLGHPFTLWSFVTLLAMLAIWRHRRRRAERRRRWELEERAEELAWEEHRRRYRVH